MLSQRLKLYRLARGLSMEELVTRAGGVVTKQALSKFEKGMTRPTHRVLQSLAEALGVTPVELDNEPVSVVKCVAYRKNASMSKSVSDVMESKLQVTLEQCVRIGKLVREKAPAILDKPKEVSSIEQAEEAANELRKKWNLGNDPIVNLTDVLESNGVYVVVMEGDDTFHGLSAHAHDSENNLVGAAVATNANAAGERQRMNLSHELGHLATAPKPSTDLKWVEKVAFRFGSAFLAPAKLVFEQVGKRRSSVSLSELRMLKKSWRMSMHAIVYRLRELEVISEQHAKDCFIAFSQRGWRKREPDPLETEEPQWFKRAVLRVYAEGLISKKEAEATLVESVSGEIPSSLKTRRALLELPLDARRRLMEQQAEQLSDHYEENRDRNLGGGDFIEYKLP